MTLLFFQFVKKYKPTNSNNTIGTNIKCSWLPFTYSETDRIRMNRKKSVIANSIVGKRCLIDAILFTFFFAIMK